MSNTNNYHKKISIHYKAIFTKSQVQLIELQMTTDLYYFIQGGT